MKLDYETMALKKAEAQGPKVVAQYKKKLAKDIKSIKINKYFPKKKL